MKLVNEDYKSGWLSHTVVTDADAFPHNPRTQATFD